MDVKGKVVIVTGASTGIGLATAELLTEKGAKVALVSRSLDRLREISAGLDGSIAIKADMTKVEEVKRMIGETLEHYGAIDILINNAGQGYYAPVEKIELESFQHIFELNLVGPLVAMQQVTPIMRAQGQGAIINISSGLALMYMPNLAGYSSLKRALGGISLTAREELKKDNISVGVVYPFITATDFQKNTIKHEPIEWSGAGERPKADTAEHVAEKILEAIETGEAEVFAHEWMGKRE